MLERRHFSMFKTTIRFVGEGAAIIAAESLKRILIGWCALSDASAPSLALFWSIGKVSWGNLVMASQSSSKM